MVHAALGYEVLRAAGVRRRAPASPTSGSTAGLRALPRSRDLRRHLADAAVSPAQHLYEAEGDGVDVAPAVPSAYEVEEGDEDDLGDLEALIDAQRDRRRLVGRDGRHRRPRRDDADVGRRAVHRSLGRLQRPHGRHAGRRTTTCTATRAGVFEHAPERDRPDLGRRLRVRRARGRAPVQRVSSPTPAAALNTTTRSNRSRASPRGSSWRSRPNAMPTCWLPARLSKRRPRREYTAQEIEEGVESTLELHRLEARSSSPSTSRIRPRHSARAVQPGGRGACSPRPEAAG